MLKLHTLILLLLISFAANAQEEQFQFFKGQKTYIKNPFELRDPFKRPNFKTKKTAKSKYGGKVEGNSFTNLDEMGNVSLNELKIVGIVLGKNRRAVAEIKGKTFILKEGMVLGDDGAELKAILPGGIVVVEKFKNVYDQDEYLETIIPVSVE